MVESRILRSVKNKLQKKRGKSMKQRIKKSVIAAVIAAAVITGGMPLSGGVPKAAALPARFTDVAASHWANGDIDFAAQKGIVNGYEAAGGTYVFYPENQVSYEEAATMLYRALAAAGRLRTGGTLAEDKTQAVGGELTEEQKNALIEKHSEELSTANIAEWAKAYVAYGLEYNIIEPDELLHFVNANTKLGNPAPRLKVAVWTAKALDKQVSGVYYLPFTDASQIDDASAKYVDMLYRHGIMKGSWQPDGTVAFQPASGVKRSEFAAISNRVFNNAGTAYDISKEMYNYKIEPGAKIESDKLRIASESTVIGSETGCGAVSGISAKIGDVPQVFLVGSPEVLTGTIKSTENINEDIIKIGVQISEKGMGREILYYILDKDTESTAKITNGTKVTFIADGVRLIEIK